MIGARVASLKGTKAHEYLIRFLLGGSVAVVAGLIADRFGPVIGGLFLAFPAIFPAAATMLEKHEREKKERDGLSAGKRGRMAAGVDAGGTALGTIGLASFALVIWKGLPNHPVWIVLTIGLICWTLMSAGLWWLRRFL
jgi:hypothetical protein